MSVVSSRLGFMFRETGQALERVGYDLGWVYTGFERYREKLCRSQPVAPVNGAAPVADKLAFIAPCANVTGDVHIERGASVFYNCVVRGDAAPVIIGKGTNIQDGCTIATSRSGPGQTERPVIIGDNVTVGHAATLRGCVIEDEALIGMGSVVLEGAVVHRGAMVAAAAVVLPDTIIPSGQLWAGNPASFKRNLKPEEAAFLPKSADEYKSIAKQHKADCDAASSGL